MIKTLIARQEWFLKAKMPFANTGGGVTTRLQ